MDYLFSAFAPPDAAPQTTEAAEGAAAGGLAGGGTLGMIIWIVVTFCHVLFPDHHATEKERQAVQIYDVKTESWRQDRYDWRNHR